MNSKDFELKNSSEGFQAKSKDIFAGIDKLKSEKSEKKEDKSAKFDKEDLRNRLNSRKESRNSREFSGNSREENTKDLKGCESIFRTPNESGWPPPRSRNQFRKRKIADHVKNPKNYTYYDMSSVSRDQMSDRSNTRAAFDFLREMRERKDGEKDEKVDQGAKISFKKPKIKEISEASSSNVVKDGVKRVMPECVVGQKKTKKVEKKTINKSSKQISLSHLDDEEEDD